VAAGSGLPFGPLTGRSIHLCIDMQGLFAEPTPWHTPWAAPVLPLIEEIVRHHAERTVFTRFLRPEEMPGTWQRYYRRWREMTLERIDPELLELVPTLARWAPPAKIVDKRVYSPFVGRTLLSHLTRVPRRRDCHHRRRDRCLCAGCGTGRGGFRLPGSHRLGRDLQLRRRNPRRAVKTLREPLLRADRDRRDRTHFGELADRIATARQRLHPWAATVSPDYVCRP
jgi:Isochorismatase family